MTGNLGREGSAWLPTEIESAEDVYSVMHEARLYLGGVSSSAEATAICKALLDAEMYIRRGTA